MKKLTKKNLNVQNFVGRNRNLQTLASRRHNAQKLPDHDLPSLPAIAGNMNTLMDIHDRFINLPNLFREKVCEECGYSLPTYYRKAKGQEQALSNAEREKIKDIEKQCIKHLMKHCGMLPADSPGEAA